MARTRLSATALFVGLALAGPALVHPGAQAAPAPATIEAREARAKIKMDKVDGAVTGGTWAVTGKIKGARKGMKVLVEWKAGSSRYPTPSARTAAVSKAGWSQIGVKKVKGSRYSINFKSDTAGTSKIRVRLVRGKRTLAKSRARTLVIVQNNLQDTTVDPAAPGQAVRSGITGQINQYDARIGTFMENVYQNVANYWQTNYNSWGYGTTTGYHYFPAPGEIIYQGCSDGVNPPGFRADDTAAYWCIANDYIIFSQAAAINFWNGRYVPGVQAEKAGDFAVALVMAHEFGHNVTYEMWPNANQYFSTYQIEGFADCLAGTWANSAYYQGILEAGDTEEAVATLVSFGYGGDSGYPDGNVRAAYFMYGYNYGSPAACAQAIL